MTWVCLRHGGTWRGGTAGEDGRVVTIGTVRPQGEVLGGEEMWLPRGGWERTATHKLWATTIEAIAVQVAVPIAGHENAAQFAVPSCVECVIRCEHQQAGHISPANLLLEWGGW